MTANPTGHPARFSTEIIGVVRELLNARYQSKPEEVLFDPFAGTGEALRALANDLFMDYGGVEIEPAFIVAPNIKQGDATDLSSYPTVPYIIFTSPAYPNGMADHFEAKDDSKRHTYRKANALLEGADRELHPNNQARYGYRGTKRHGKSTKRDEYWRIAREAVMCWGSAEMILLNVSDFKHSRGEIEPLVQDWRTLLSSFGWSAQTEIPVGTKRQRQGANGNERMDVEVVVVAER